MLIKCKSRVGMMNAAPGCGCFGVPLSKVVFVIDVHQQVETQKFFTCSSCTDIQLLGSSGHAIISVLCVWRSVMSQGQVECLCSSSTLISEGESWLKLWPVICEFLLLLLLEQCGSRRLFSTIRPNFVLELYHLAQFFREKGIQVIAFGSLNTWIIICCLIFTACICSRLWK